MKICIDAGHTINGGAFGYLNEAKETRVVAEKVIKGLKAEGHTVYNCTVDSGTNTLAKICENANKQNADLFVSIHFNAFNGSANGTEVYTYGAQKHPEAVAVLNNLCKIGFTNRGLKNGDWLYVIKNTNAKAMLIEVCFVDSQKDVDIYNKNVDKVAEAIVAGITGSNISKSKSDSYLKEFEEAKDVMMSLGVTDGSNPTEPITREQAWTMLYRLYKKL